MRCRGFSLIELLTVVLIMGILTAIAIPLGLNWVRNYEVTGAASNVASQMQLSRGQAVKRNTRRGILLNFNYPQPGQYQFTTLDEDPVNGGWDGAVYPANPGVFDPNPPRNYGSVPVPPNNQISPGGGLPSPHGPVLLLPGEVQFIDGQAFTSLLFRVDGSVEAVNAANVGSQVVAQNGLTWVVRLQSPRYGLSRTVSVSRNGRVVVTTP